MPKLIAATFAVLQRRIPDHEIIVINDGSSDGTAEVLADLERQYRPYLRVVSHSRNRGFGAALRSGFDAATKDWVFYTDGDGQYDPGELDLLLDAVDTRTGLVNGYKVQRQDPWHRIAIGLLYNRFARSLFRIRIRDIDCDFRLIRRALLHDFTLQSTSGTVCIELVRKLELSGAEIAEVPVSHYRRLHGRSQFFRLQSLAVTFVQLCGMFFGLVLLPALSQLIRPGHLAKQTRNTPSPVMFIGMGAALLCLALMAYARALGLPFIADDYVQIELGREYGPASKWGSLASDALYRCRATSLVMTYWTERFFGLNPVVFNASSLVVHFLNSFLVFLLGLWRPIGWKISAVAASLFAVSSHHQEAVMWYAAIPELLVFLFAVSSFLCWVVWVESRSLPAYVSSLALFFTALLSKESAVAVVPLMAASLLYDCRDFRKRVLAIAPVASAGVLYFLLAYQNRSTHLHFNDGTFSLAAPFWQVLINSIARLLWFWGALAIAALVYWRAWRHRTVLGIAAVWMVITLLPYSFLTYMLRVPSRHMYFASAGMCLIVAAGILEFQARIPVRHRRWAMGALASAILIHHVAYIWTKKHDQFLLRAAPTEQLVAIVERTSGPVYLKCFPYDESIAILAVRHRGRPENRWRPLIIGGEAALQPHAFDLCNAVTGRGRF